MPLTENKEEEVLWLSAVCLCHSELTECMTLWSIMPQVPDKGAWQEV